MPFDLSKVKPYPASNDGALSSQQSTGNFNLSGVKPYPGTEPAPIPQQKPAAPTVFQSIVAGFNNSIENLTVGSMQGVGRLLNIRTPGLDKYLQESVMRADIAAQYHPTATGAGQITGDIAKTIPLALMGGPTLAGMVGSGALAGAGMGLAEAPEEGQTRVGNAVTQGVAGAVGGALGYGANKLIGLGKEAFSKGAHIAGQAAKNITAPGAELEATTLLREAPVVGDLPAQTVASKAEQAANRLGTFVSGTETTASPALRSMPMEIQSTPKRAAAVAQRLITRERKLSDALKGIVKQVNPQSVKETKAVATSIYNELKPKELSTKAINNLMGAPKGNSYVDELYADAHKRLNFENIKAGTWEDLDKVRSFIDDKIQTANNDLLGARAKGVSSGSKGAIVGDLLDAKKKITLAMNSVDPTFDPKITGSGKLAEADKLWAKAGFETKINMTIDKINLTKSGQEQPLSGQVYSKILSSPEKQNKFIASVRNLGGDKAASQAQDLVTVLNTIQDSPLAKYIKKSPFTKDADNVLGITQGGSITNKGLEMLKRVVSGKHDQRWFELMLDPKFSQTADKLSKEAVVIQNLINKKPTEAGQAAVGKFIKGTGLLIGEEVKD